MRRTILGIAFLSVGIIVGMTGEVGADSERDVADLAEYLVEEAGITRGLCSVLGAGDGALALELVRASGLVIHVQDPLKSSVADARATVDVDGLYGKRIIVDEGPLNQLPYAGNTVDLVVSASWLPGSSPELSVPEILRVLRPGGTALIGSPGASKERRAASELERWLRREGVREPHVAKNEFGVWARITKPRPEGTDAWSHWQHGPDNNAVSTDALIRAPYRTQWFGKPYYIAMPSVTTAAGGRIFTAMGHIAHHKREEPWLNMLLARNGYNGIELWRRKLPDGYLAHRSAFIATDDVFYMIDGKGDACLMLDPETGKEIDRIVIPEIDGEWKWIAIQDGVLFVLAEGEKDPPETTLVRSKGSHWGWGSLSNGFYQERVPWGFGRAIVAYDMDKRKTLWRYEEEHPIDSRTTVIGDGKVFFYCPDAHTGCIGARTGKVLWTNGDRETLELIEQPGKGLTNTPGFRTMCYSLYAPDAIVFGAQTRMNVVAVSTRDGSLMWTRQKTTNNPNMLYVDGRVLVGIGPGGRTLALDPGTGQTVEDLSITKAGCARLTATPDSLFCRGMPDGLQRYDRRTKKLFFNGAVRPGCTDGAIGANGLLYVGPWLCDCNLSLMGTVAMCSAGGFNVEDEDPLEQRLELGEGDIVNVASLDTTAIDWPTYRANYSRNALSNSTVSSDPEPLWTFEPGHGFVPTAPTAAGGLVFVGGDDGKVRAFEAGTGELIWRFATSGPIKQPPTIWNGRAYVGSGDGNIYALEARTGRLLWRFRAAPVERKIMIYGSLCSAWPINTGVLVEDGVAYAAAGIIDYDGTYVYALDAVTGKLKWRNNTSGHLNKEARKGVSAQGTLTILDGKLWMAGGNVVSPAAYDLVTGECVSSFVGRGGPASNRGEELGVLKKDRFISGGRLMYSAEKNVVNPGLFFVSAVDTAGRPAKQTLLTTGKLPPAWSDEMLVYSKGPNEAVRCVELTAIETFRQDFGEKNLVEQYFSLDKLEHRWKAAIPENTDMVGCAMTPNAVVAVCEVPGPRPDASHWFVAGLNPQDGNLMWQKLLPGAAFQGGVLINRDGRIIVVLRNGGIACFG